MIICKYTKLNAMIYTPHLDLLRTVGMAIRRAGTGINFSEGFNPHAKLFFTQPLPLGTGSVSEYFAADCDVAPDEFMDRLNPTLPDGLKILKAARIKDSVSPASLTERADYEVFPFPALKTAYGFSKVLNEDSYEITFTAKGEEKVKDVRRLIYGIREENGALYFSLACGNANLRADRLAQSLFDGAGVTAARVKIVKTAMYGKSGENLDTVFFGGQG